MIDNSFLATFSVADLEDGKPMGIEIDGKDAVVVRHGGKLCVVP
ncbi:Rieske (2Fe-2S) protein [Tsuneonella amylolytica]|nr:hypothetical protein [Tsuneonella amylolytica]